MLKKYLIAFFLITLFSIGAHAAGTDDSSSKIKSNYDKAVSLIKSAKKYEKKAKLKKLIKDMRKLKNY